MTDLELGCFGLDPDPKFDLEPALHYGLAQRLQQTENYCRRKAPLY